jgi:hypothetical protein
MRPCPKPEPRRTAKARKAREEAAVKRQVRAACVRRDGACRIWRDHATWAFDCDGPSEWAHLGDHRRSRTRGQDAEVRHTTAGSLMLCRRHHQQYDAHRIEILPRTAQGADGPLTIGYPAPTLG